MFATLTILTLFVIAGWVWLMNLAYRVRAMETRIDNTNCVLLHPERMDAWCPEGQDKLVPVAVRVQPIVNAEWQEGWGENFQPPL